MFARRPRPPQLKFNDSFNQYFPRLIFLKSILRVKTGEVGGEILNCYQKMVQLMVKSTSHVIAGPDSHRARTLALWRFSQHLSSKCR